MMTTQPRAQGIDVSRFQTALDWPAAKAAGIDFVFVKATDGAAVTDPRFALHWSGAKAAGLLRGAYHYYRPAQDPAAQAENLARALSADPGELPPVLDLEESIGATTQLSAQVLTWLQEVERRLKRRPLIYTSASKWSSLMKDAAGQFPAWAKDYRLWVANYPFNKTPSTQPRLPLSWNTWTFWQYTNKGAVNGVTGPVDRDEFNGSRDDLLAWVRSLAPGVVPKVTNQVMINAFSKAFGAPFWDVITRAGLTGMAIPSGNRGQPYAGPPIDGIPNLTDAEKAALREALYLKWTQHALPGLHGPADPGGGWVPEAYEVVRQSKVRAVKMLVPDLQPNEVATLRGINPEMFIMARLFSGQLNNPQGGGTPEGAGRWFANEVADRGDGNNPMNRAYNSGVRYFEVHNEPNLSSEGLGANWRDGAEFARFFNTVVAELKPRYPEARFGFPGLSPGPVIAQRLIDVLTFLDQARDAVTRADFLCGHVYWGRDNVVLEMALDELSRLCDLYPNKLILCTEFSNNRGDVPREHKADEYARFYVACQSLPANLGGLFIFVLSWRNDVNNEGFLRLSADGSRWEPTPMAARLGSHDF